MTTQSLIDDLFREGVPYARSLESRLIEVLVSMGADSAAVTALLREGFPYNSSLNARIRQALELVGVSAADTADLFNDSKSYSLSFNARLLYAFAHAGPSIQASASTFAESAAINDAVWTLSMANHSSGASGWTFTIDSQTPSGKLKITTSPTVLIAAQSNYDAGETGGTVTYRATKSGQADVTTTVAYSVTNVLEVTLGTVALSSLSWTTASSTSGTITGKTSGSTLSLSGSLPAGLTLDLNALTWAWDHSLGSVSTGSFAIIETHPDGTNSPKSNTQSWAITSAPALSGHVTMGDSWTFNGGYWRDAFEAARPGTTFHTVSGNGWGVASNLIGAVSTVAALLPASVSILAGINDLQTISAAQELTDLQTLVSNLKTAIPGVKVFVSTVPPSTTANINTRRATLNPNIRAGSGVWHDGVIPIGDYLEDAIASDTTYYDNTAAPGHPKAPLSAIISTITGAVLDPYFAGATATSPTAFTIADIPGAPTSRSYTQFSSAPITGMAAGNGATGVLTGAGTWKLGRGGTSNTSNKTVYNGDWPAITQTSSATYPPETAVDSTLTIGTRADTFTQTTGPLAADTFTRADGALGTTETGGLTWYGPGQVVSNKLQIGQISSGSGRTYAAVNPGVQDIDITAKIFMPSNWASAGGPRLIIAANKGGSGNVNWESDFGRAYFVDFRNGSLTYKHETFGYFTNQLTFTPPAANAEYTVRVLMKTSSPSTDRTFKMWIDGTLTVDGSYANDSNFWPTGTWMGLGDELQNGNNTMDDLVIVAA